VLGIADLAEDRLSCKQEKRVIVEKVVMSIFKKI
jgi:hypothetical protein